MSAHATELFEYLEDIRKPSRYANQWAFPTHAAVGPHGQIVTRHINSEAQAQGDVPILVVDGLPVISPRYARDGWVLYEDLCKGRVPGIDGDADAWTRWVNLKRLRAEGRELPPGVIKDEDAFWHPEIARRRAAAPGFAATRDPAKAMEQMRAMFPGVDLNDPTERKTAKKK